MNGSSAFVVGGRPVPSDRLGELRDSQGADDGVLRRRLAQDGYVLVRSVLARDAVLAARQAVFEHLAAVGEVRRPATEGIATGGSDRAEVGDLDAFWRTVSELPALRRVTHGDRLAHVMAGLLDEAVRAFDFIWLRPVAAGRASPLHFDHVYMNRGSARVLTAWIPLGDVAAGHGPLVIVEGAHRFPDLTAQFAGHDVDRDPVRPGHLQEDALSLAEARDCRLLSTDFRAGDVVVFGMFTLHGSCDNLSAEGRVRLSCDVRYQPAADAVDARWFGSPPPGHGGRGYGGLSAAQPLTAAPLRR